jgi:hypothetical protein
MKYSIDQIDDGIAVLIPLDGSGEHITIPVAGLPSGSREGDVLTLTFERDPAATAAAKEHISGLIEYVKKNG